MPFYLLPPLFIFIFFQGLVSIFVIFKLGRKWRKIAKGIEKRILRVSPDLLIGDVQLVRYMIFGVLITMLICMLLVAASAYLVAKEPTLLPFRTSPQPSLGFWRKSATLQV